MKTFLPTMAGLTFALAASTAVAQPVAAPAFTHEKAVEAATYLARQKAFSEECPFSAPAKTALERLERLALPALGLTQPELDAIGTDAKAAALELIKEPQVKRITCPILDAALRRQTDQPGVPTPPLPKPE